MRSNVTGGGHYNSEYRNFNRGFGRGYGKSFQSSQRQQSPQPARRGDIFLEAGKLAVEYLVSHGLLSSNVLPGKGQNGTLRSNSREFKDHRDREIPNSPVDGRSVATTHQGAATPDGVSSSRKSQSDYDPSLIRSSLRERRRLGASRSFSADWGRENGREGSLSDRATGSHGVEADNDKSPKDVTKDADTDDRSSQPVESASEDNRHKELQVEMENCRHHVDSDLKMASTLQNKDDEELEKPSDGVHSKSEEAKDGIGNLDMEKETSRDGLVIQHCEEKNDASTKDGSGLLQLCPTNDRSSSMDRSPKSDPLPTPEEKSKSDNGHDSLDSPKDVAMNGSSDTPCSTEAPSSVCAVTPLPEHSFRDEGVVDPAPTVDQPKPSESLSFTDQTYSFEQKSGVLSELGSCSSFGKDRGEKRGHEEENVGEGAKKAKQWLSVAQCEDYSPLSDLSDNQSVALAKRGHTLNIFNRCANEENFNNESLPLKGGVDSGMEQGEGKQLFSSSFKICDLNLMEASDMHDNHDGPARLYPPVSAQSKDSSVGIDLSMNNSCNLNGGYGDSRSARKDIEIIDLESASFQEEKTMPTRNLEADISTMGNFPNNSQNTNDNPDGQDGYGFMISELLGNDNPNCSTVQPDMNSLHNDMGLHHGEGIFTEDDPIYMSLGEIPISLLRVWEQPTQEKNPFGL